MRDCLKNRGGFDRVLMAVAATFLTISATSAMAQADQSRSSAAELAIDAAIPRPEPANVPPPTINDFKMDTTASVPDAAKTPDGKTETKPADVVVAPADANKAVPPSNTATAPSATAPAATAVAPSAAEPAKDAAKDAPPPSEPVKAASNVPAADQPVADKIKEMLSAKSLRYFERKVERADVEKFYGAREYAPIWTQAGGVSDSAKGVIARLKDAASDGLNASDYPVPDFAAAATPDALADADLKLTSSMLDYARQAQSGRIHWSQVSGDIQYPEHPIDPTEVLGKVTTAKDASIALDSYNPPQKLYKELKAKLAELRGQGDKPVITIADGAVLRYTPPRGKKPPEAVMQ